MSSFTSDWVFKRLARERTSSTERPGVSSIQIGACCSNAAALARFDVSCAVN